MPRVIKLDFISSNTELPIIPTSVPPTPIADLWDGMQYWLDTSWPSTSNPLYPADYPVVELRNKYGYQWQDAAGRLSWTDSAGITRHFAHRFNGGGGNAGWPVLSQFSGDLINGTPALTAGFPGEVLNIFGDPLDRAAFVAAETRAYTTLLIHKASSGATGGILGQLMAGSADDPAAGLRYGYESGTNTGKTLYQHGSGTGDRVLIPRDTANSMPVRAIITCSPVDSGGITTHAGAVNIVNNGVDTTHSFSFLNPVNLGLDPISIGYMDNAGSSRMRIALCARWSRVLKPEEIEYLKSWTNSRFGAF